MRLAVNLIANGRYYREGDDVDEALVPSNLRKLNHEYAAGIRRDREGMDGSKPAPHPSARAKGKADQRWVRRGFAFRKVELESLVPGERLYGRKAGSSAFFRVGRVPKGANAV